MEEFSLVEAINQYGFPIIAACGLGYFVYYIWQWVTNEIDPMIGDATKTLIALVDRIRMLDNDMIRLNTKLAMVLEYYNKTNKSMDPEMEDILNKYKTTSQGFDQSGVEYDRKKSNTPSDNE